MRRHFIYWVVIFLISQSVLAWDPKDFAVIGRAEYGFAGIPLHTVQFGETNRPFNYVTEGGEDVLFPFARFAIDLFLFDHHTIEFVYQPLYLTTNSTLKTNVQFDNTLFLAGEALSNTYDFPFYRLIYMYQFNVDPGWNLSIGAGVQIRNVTVEFQSQNTGQMFRTSNIGPVPLIAFRGRYNFPSGVWLMLDTAGFWANLPFLNGGKNQVNGWIYDAAFLSGVKIASFLSAYISLRVLGGGAIGKSTRNDGSINYSSDILVTIDPTLGIEITLPS